MESLRSELTEKKSSLECLPNELLINILQYLCTFDLLQFFKAYEHFDYFLREKDVIWNSDWARRYELHDLNICKFISTKMNPLFIKFLNINCLYWIPCQDLCKLLSKLINLEELRAIDTKIGMREIENIELLKLKKLAVSVESRSVLYVSKTRSPFSNLKSLYLKMYLNFSNDRESAGFSICRIPHLEELWIEDIHESPFKMYYEGIVRQMKNLKKLVIRSNGVLPIYEFRAFGLYKTFECKKCNAGSDLIFEKISINRFARRSIFEPKSTALERAWDVFKSLHGSLPCGPKENKMFEMFVDVLNVNFEELDFCHMPVTCNARYVDAALEVLRSSNAKGLKKLQFMSCLLQKGKPEPDDEEACRSFKRPRRGVQSKPQELHPFSEIAENIKNVTELEIFSCSRCRGTNHIPAYPLLGVFKHLKRLSLEIPSLLDGSFLKEVFTKCQVLESLSIECTTTNEKFMINLCQHLKLSTALRDFRLVHMEINIENLLASLSDINNKKLVRIVLRCNTLRYSNKSSHTEPFEIFLRSNPQLILFYLIVSNATKKQMLDIRNKIFFEFKEKNKAKLLYAGNEEAFVILPAHRDIVFRQNRVAVVDFDEF